MICLIRPPAVESFRFSTTSITLPLGLAYIAASLEASGREVTVVDAVGLAPRRHTGYYKGYLVGLRLEDIVARIPPDARFVGISVIFTHEWPAVVRLVELIREARANLTIVLGGEHTTAMPEFSLSTSAADILVLGEGEETVVALAGALEAGTPLEEVAGIAFRKGGENGKDGEIIVNQRRKRRRDIDEIAPPAWRHFDVAGYHANRFVGGMFTTGISIPMLATRGCPYQCTYCSAPSMWTTRWLPRDPVAVVDEIQSYVERYGARNFPLQDLTAIVQKDWIVAFCKEILARGLDISWQLPTGTRSEAIDGEVAGLLRDSGMVCMAYAPESGSEETRRLVKKRMKTDDLFQSIHAAGEAGLNVSIFLVIGFPHDRRDHLAENLAFVDRLGRSGVSDLSVGYYMALPGTELFHSLFDSGRLRVDRAYFRHILDSLALVPSQSYSVALGRFALMYWKLRLLMRFYVGRKSRKKGRSALLESLRHVLDGFSKGSHESKLQTAMHNGVTSAFHHLCSTLGPRWMPRRDEARVFVGWDDLCRALRRKKIAQGIAALAPADSTELHKVNVIKAIHKDHQLVQSFPAA